MLRTLRRSCTRTLITLSLQLQNSYVDNKVVFFDMNNMYWLSVLRLTSGNVYLIPWLAYRSYPPSMFFKALVSMIQNSFSPEWFPDDHICTNDLLHCSVCNPSSMSVVLSPWIYLASLMYCMQQNGAGTIHKKCSLPLPCIVVPVILKAHV